MLFLALTKGLGIDNDLVFLIDGGNPVGMSSTVQSDGSVTGDGGPNPTSGYSLVSAQSLESALEIAKGCPILKAEGSVEVAEAMEM